MSIARRTLLTATAAGTVLCALWFVPSANATDGTAVRNISADSARSHQASAVQEDGAQEDVSTAAFAGTETGIGTTPYLIGGTALLMAGAGFVTHTVHRSTRPTRA